MARRSLTAALLVAVAACGDAEPESPVGGAPLAPRDVEVTAARVLAPSSPERTALYADVANPGSMPDTLISISSPAAEESSLHEMAIEGGMMRMSPIEYLVIPVGSTVSLAPGGLHGMLDGLTSALAVGDSVEVTLLFALAGSQTVWATVQDPANARD